MLRGQSNPPRPPLKRGEPVAAPKYDAEKQTILRLHGKPGSIFSEASCTTHDPSGIGTELGIVGAHLFLQRDLIQISD